MTRAPLAPQAPLRAYPSKRAAFWSASRIAAGAPSAVLAAGYLGFAALAKSAGFPLWAALLSSFSIWALPGQLVMMEMALSGAAAVLVVIAVGLTAMRFLPMAVSFLPLIRSPQDRRWHLALAAHVLAMTNWALCLPRVQELPREQRMPYFLGFAVTNWLLCVLATAVGYFLTVSFPPLVNRGLIMVSPLYFTVILIGETRRRVAVAALAFGAVLGPAIHLYAPQWSVLVAGVAGGTAAYLLFRGRRA